MEPGNAATSVLDDDAPPSPAPILEALFASALPYALGAAAELSVFTAIGEGRTTARDVAARCGASPRGIAMLGDYLVLHGYLTKDGDRYGLTATASVFLDRRSPAYIGDATAFFLSPQRLGAFARLADAVRDGGNRRPDAFVAPDNPVWVAFAHGMAPLMIPIARALAARLEIEALVAPRVLDVSAGHGEFGIATARANPKATVDALDWGPVLGVARERADAAGVGERFRFIPGSAFDVPFDGPYDVVLFPSFLHHFDTATAERFVAKVRRALLPGGKAATVEFVVNEDRLTPAAAARFAIEMLAVTPSGNALTAAELRGIFRTAGFSDAAVEPLAGTPFTLAVASA